jgi:hypothetical protein
MSMAWVAGGAALVGAGASIYNTNKAADSARKTGDDTLDAQWAMYDQDREDKAPYRELGEDAMPEYYKMLGLSPKSLSYSEWTGENYPDIVGEGDEDYSAQNADRYAEYQKYKTDNESQSGEAPPLSPLGRWQEQEFFKKQNRQDAARGLSGSGGASARLGEGSMQIAGQDYQNSYNRILDALKLGSGNGASAGNANMMNAIGTAGQNDQQITLDQGQSEGNFWAGAGNTVGQGLATYQSNQTPGGGTAPTGGGFNGNPNPSMGAGGYTAIQPGM